MDVPHDVALNVGHDVEYDGAHDVAHDLVFSHWRDTEALTITYRRRQSTKPFHNLRVPRPLLELLHSLTNIESETALHAGFNCTR
jgi:hypothetical protein